jgi:hypothetical protein
MTNDPVDVAGGAPNPESYTDNGDGTVTDNVTGLMWQQAFPETPSTRAGAIASCPTLTLGGHSDWRLPSVIELVSLLDYAPVNSRINTVYFPQAVPTGDIVGATAFFWSSTLVGGCRPYGVGLNGGGPGPPFSPNPDPPKDAGFVRCVR